MRPLAHQHDAVASFIAKHSGLRTHRPYLGMSGIGYCPLRLYDLWFNGVASTPMAHANAYRGYFYEAEIRRILCGAGVLVGGVSSTRTLIAGFDSRFQGHTDGEDVDGRLVEIKSMSPNVWADVMERRRLPAQMFQQVQTYMLYGGYKEAAVWMVNTSTFAFNALVVRPVPHVQASCEAKAMRILEAIDQREPPNCVCGRCSGS